MAAGQTLSSGTSCLTEASPLKGSRIELMSWTRAVPFGLAPAGSFTARAWTEANA